jgi:hypothetical protein
LGFPLFSVHPRQAHTSVRSSDRFFVRSSIGQAPETRNMDRPISTGRSMRIFALGALAGPQRATSGKGKGVPSSAGPLQLQGADPAHLSWTSRARAVDPCNKDRRSARMIDRPKRNMLAGGGF